MRRFGTVTMLVVTMALSLPAAANETEGPVHLALGDSVAWGFGTERPDHHGYSAVLSRFARSMDCREDEPAGCPRLELVNMSVPGAKSGDLIEDQLPDALALLEARNGDTDPGNDVELITITIGGNDLFQPVVDACLGGVTDTCVGVIVSGLNDYADNLAVILGGLRAAAPDTEIVIMTYYNPLGTCVLADLTLLADNVLEGLGGLPTGLNPIIRATAQGFGVKVAETHLLLDDQDFVGGNDCLHPDKSGYHKIAKAFEAVLD